jgi:hypothetical protein
MTPQPWARTGPGLAKDGKPRFDLDQFDPAFFERLRQRVVKAGEAGIYVGVMLFDGWALHLSPPPDNVEGHPFHALNNVNGISATTIDDVQVLPLDARVQAIELAYIRQVVDTVHDLPNVLWEVANESSGDGSVTKEFASFFGMKEPPVWGDSTEWQYWVIDVVKTHEAERGYDAHPIGITMQFPVRDQTRVNEPLLRSRAEWISPGYDDEIFTAGRHPMAPGTPASPRRCAPGTCHGSGPGARQPLAAADPRTGARRSRPATERTSSPPRSTALARHRKAHRERHVSAFTRSGAVRLRPQICK